MSRIHIMLPGAPWIQTILHLDLKKLYFRDTVYREISVGIKFGEMALFEKLAKLLQD